MIGTQDAILIELTRTLVEAFDPERIVLFGSRGRGDHHAESDYDVMIVVDRSDPPSERAVRDAVESLHIDADVVVDTCERFERRRTDVGTLEFVADQEGRLLYARSQPQVRHVREE